jgi:hypothetical protein
MGWDKKGKAGPYYYRSRKVDGRVTKEYLGRGPDADEAAAVDEEARVRRRAHQSTRAETMARVAAATQLTCDLSVCVDLIVRAKLLLSGFYFHRGEYRRRRARHGGRDGRSGY